MIVKGGNTHAGDACEIFHTERFCEVRLDPGDRLRRSLALVPSCCDCSEPRGFWPLKNPVDNFALNQAAQKRYVLRGFEKLYQTATCIEQLSCRFSGRHCRVIRSCRAELKLVFVEEFSDDRDIER